MYQDGWFNLSTNREKANDILETAIIIARKNRNQDTNAIKFNEIQKGLRNFTNFIITNNFRIEEAISASAKAAYVAMKVKNTIERIIATNVCITINLYFKNTLIENQRK